MEGIQTDYYDIYRSARNESLKRIFPEYPEMSCKSFELSFTVNNAKNAPILYLVLETIPEKMVTIDGNNIRISASNNTDFLSILEKVCDVMSIVRGWRSVVFQYNGVYVDNVNFGYFLDYILETNSIKSTFGISNAEAVKNKYKKAKPKKKKSLDLDDIYVLSRKDYIHALKTVLRVFVKHFCGGLNYEMKKISNEDVVLVIEDSAIIDFRIAPNGVWGRAESGEAKPYDYPYVIIQELVKNDLFKVNFAGFKRLFFFDYIGLDFFPFKGKDYYRDAIDNYYAVNEALPDLQLLKRSEEYEGEVYHFIVFEMLDVNEQKHYGIGYTKGKVHAYVLKICSELETKNSRTLVLNGSSSMPYALNKDFIQAFLSWEGKKKRWRLENKLSYFYLDRILKSELELFDLPDQILKDAKNGAFSKEERGYYSKPLNKWKSEELVYNITKKLYGDYSVIYQHHPYYLSTNTGSMSYDVYICGLKVAIEYQGKQHFEPVDYFGGKDSFEKQQERDELKAQLSKENGVKLVYINYWEDITPDLIKNKVSAVLLDEPEIANAEKNR